MFEHTAPTNDLGLPYGWFDVGDIETYKKLVSSIPQKGTLVEVGVWQGRSLCSIADLIREKEWEVYAIDTFGGSESAPNIVHDCDGKLREVFEGNLKQYGISEYVTILEMNSVSAAHSLETKVDFVFIDADHAEEQVRADIQAWSPIVKGGGTLAGHDYQWVNGVVHRELGEYEVQTDERNLWWIESSQL